MIVLMSRPEKPERGFPSWAFQWDSEREDKLFNLLGNRMKIFRIFFYLVSFFLLTFPLYAADKNASSGTAVQSAPVSFGDADQDNAEPYAELEKMSRDLNRILQAGLAQAGRSIDWAQSRGGVFNPRLDMIEEKGRYLLKADVPGIDKNKLDLQVTDKTLTIAGERSIEEKTEDAQTGVYRQERSFGHFQRTIQLPDNVQKDKISAKYDLGVLTIELPKITPSTPAPNRSRKIQVV